MNQAITENTILTFGIHKGKKIKDVPSSWLVEWSQNQYARGPVQRYIQENISSIKAKAEYDIIFKKVVLRN